MADLSHMEKMENELKCPICLSLFDSARTIPCNHVFCNSCIQKSMKCASNCPVCKIPFHRREIRAAPHMDNLVNIFKSMQFATGAKNLDGSEQNIEANTSGANSNKAKKNKRVSKPNSNSSKSISNPRTNPTFPAKKRVHVTPFPLNDTPVRPEKVLKLSDLNDQSMDNKEIGKSEKVVANLLKSPSLSPFFCLMEDQEEENEGGENDNLVSLSDEIPTPNAPSFSDIKDSDDERNLSTTPNSKVKAKEASNSQISEWTQRACSKKLCLTPPKKNKGKKRMDHIEDKIKSQNEEISPVNNEEIISKNKRKRNKKAGPSVSNKRIVKNSEKNAPNSTDKEKIGDLGKPLLPKRKNRKENPKNASNRKTKTTDIISSSVSTKRGRKSSKEKAQNLAEEKFGEMNELSVPKRKNHKENPAKVNNSVPMQETDKNNGEKESKTREKISKEKKIDECVLSDFGLKKCENVSSKVVCAFCHSADVTEVSGEMVHYLEGKPVNSDFNGEGNVIHSHKNCLEWAPDVYFEDDVAVNLAAELARSKRIKCGFCGIKGAALGCFHDSCRKSFHFTCAKLVPQCKWDDENFVMLCPIHQSSKLPVETAEPQKKNKNKSATKSNPQVSLSLTQAWKWPGSTSKWVLSCSALSPKEKELVSQFSRLTGVTISKCWSPNITHVIASTDETGACKRTLKYLMAILSGKWILTIDWIRVCMEAKEPVGEKIFEVKIDVHGIINGPTLGRLRIANKEPKLFDQMKFYLTGDYTKDYRGFIQDLIMKAGGAILQRKPISRDRQKLLDDSPQTYIIYSMENREKCDERVLLQAEALADVAGCRIASTAWIIDSIAACKLQSLI